MANWFLPIFLWAGIAAHGAETPVTIRYFRTGSETPAFAETAAADEIAKGNECLRMLLQDAESSGGFEAVLNELRAYSSAREKHDNHFVVEVSRGSIALIFEEFRDGKRVARVRKMLSERPGTWRERLGRNHCRISKGQIQSFVDIVLEPARLGKCRNGWANFFKLAKRVAEFLHDYVPEKWIAGVESEFVFEEGKPKLLSRDLLEHAGNAKTYLGCDEKMKLLVSDTLYTIRILEAIADKRPEVGLPAKSIEAIKEAALFDSPTESGSSN